MIAVSIIFGGLIIGAVIAVLLLDKQISKKKKHAWMLKQASFQPYTPSTKKPNPHSNEHCPYRKAHLLTNNELRFYGYLKRVADKQGFVILSKIRMADLVEPTSLNRREYYRAFGRIKAKHVDFALARPEDLRIVLLIELDDASHKPGNERDAFVEWVYAAVGYKLLRVKNGYGLEEEITKAMTEESA